MTYITEYWNDKEKRAKQAKKHTEKMQDLYAPEILESVRSTTVYDTDFTCDETKSCGTNITVEATDSVSSIIKHSDAGKVAVLNFASYKNPGGMFLNGSKAQEECLCHESFLYNVLSQFTIEFYAWNNVHKNRALYLNRALYSPNIFFFRNGKNVVCDVITCAAPNKSTAQRYQGVTDAENLEVLKSRIKYVLDVAKDNKVDTLILGAYGCGVFGQDASEVASTFKEYLTTTHKCFRQVIFAIPEGRDGNLGIFKRALLQ